APGPIGTRLLSASTLVESSYVGARRDRVILKMLLIALLWIRREHELLRRRRQRRRRIAVEQLVHLSDEDVALGGEDRRVALHPCHFRFGLERILSRSAPGFELSRRASLHRAHRLDVMRVDLERPNRDEVLVVELDRGERELATHALEVVPSRLRLG